MKIGRVLIIAGSDSSGGAGVQADIKTCAAFGVYSATAITAITAQNTIGVQQVEVLAAELVAAQIGSVLADIGADVIKIGMLANGEIIEAVANTLQAEAPDTTLVLDPVLLATSGDVLLESKAVEGLKEKLLPMADVLTPNISEAELLTDYKITDPADMIKAGEKLMDMGAGAVLMKGGHLPGKSVIDILITPEGNQIMTSARIYSRHTHGTGCTLASAIAALLARGMALEAAVVEARDFVHEAIKTAPGLGAGHGPLNHGLATEIDEGIDDDLADGDLRSDNAGQKSPFAGLKNLTKPE